MALRTDAREWRLRTAGNEDEMWTLADEEGVRAARRAYPSGWLFLTRDDATRDVASLATEAGGTYASTELAEELDHAEAHVEWALSDLTAVGVFHEDESDVGPAFRPNPHSVVRRSVERLDEAIAAAGEGGFREVGAREPVRLLVDTLLSMDDGQLAQSDLHNRCGLSRKEVWMHADTLLALGVLVESESKYEVDEESTVYRCVRALDAAVVGAALSP